VIFTTFHHYKPFLLIFTLLSRGFLPQYSHEIPPKRLFLNNLKNCENYSAEVATKIPGVKLSAFQVFPVQLRVEAGVVTLPERVVVPE
jgi:hypothetical protein